MQDRYIKIRGARTHNLKNIDLDIPIGKLIGICGPSGSGKSSLAFHTIYAESKRRFLNSFPTYVKFFSERPAPPDIDSIEPVLPVFAMPQKNPISNSRSAVADVMGLTEDLCNLFSLGKAYCRTHDELLVRYGLIDELARYIQSMPPEVIVHVTCLKNEYEQKLYSLPKPTRSATNEKKCQIKDFSEDDNFWEVYRFRVKNWARAQHELQFLNEYKILKIAVHILDNEKWSLKKLSTNDVLKCTKCDEQIPLNINPTNFNPYNALGACIHCKGHGSVLVYDDSKLIREKLSIVEGGFKLLEYKRFAKYKEVLISELKKNKKISYEINSELIGYYRNGLGKYPGEKKLLAFLESKKYKTEVRVYIRSIQKEITCELCKGTRINPIVYNYRAKNVNIFYDQIWTLNINQLKNVFENIKPDLYSFREHKILKNINEKLKFASDLGLGHLKLTRKTKTISTGEYQRLLFLKYLSYEGTGALFIFDEPSIGLSPNENVHVLQGLRKLVEQGNTVILIEHSDFLLKATDYIISVGPMAGKNGGEILYQGDSKLYNFPKSKYIHVGKKYGQAEMIHVIGPKCFDITYSDFSIYRNRMNVVFGPSGSGKSNCIINVFANYIVKENNLECTIDNQGEYQKINGNISFKEVVLIQGYGGNLTSRSNVGTFTELSGVVRKHYIQKSFANYPELKDGHLSYHSSLGQCPACQGSGKKVIEMQYMEDVVLICPDCDGKRLLRKYANIYDGKRTFHDTMCSPLNEFIDDYRLTPKFKRVMDYLKILNLDYLSLDRPINSLSGGEKQRIYLLKNIMQNIEDQLIIIENLSAGLSQFELNSIGQLLNKMVDKNTDILIDQNKYFQDIADHKVEFKT